MKATREAVVALSSRLRGATLRLPLHFIKIAITIPMFFAVIAEAGDQERGAIPFEFKFSKARMEVHPEWRSRVLEGRLTLSPDSLRFEPQEERPYDRPYAPPHRYEPLALSLREVDRIETPNGSWAGLGASIGGVAGFVTTLVVFDGASKGALFGTFLFILPGALIGALAGTSVDRWQTVYDPQASSRAPVLNEGRNGGPGKDRRNE